MNKNKTTNILLIILILIIGIGIIIYILPSQKILTINDAINDINKQEKTKYTIKNIKWNFTNGSKSTYYLNKSQIYITFNPFIEYFDNNHKVTKIQ